MNSHQRRLAVRAIRRQGIFKGYGKHRRGVFLITGQGRAEFQAWSLRETGTARFSAQGRYSPTAVGPVVCKQTAKNPVTYECTWKEVPAPSSEGGSTK